jgi:hypothetical protein
MKRKLKSNTLLFPIWKITLFDELEFYVLGQTKKQAIIHILYENTIQPDDIKLVELITDQQAKNILIDIDSDFDNFECLYNEALWVQTKKDVHYMVACCYDVLFSFEENVKLYDKI